MYNSDMAVMLKKVLDLFPGQTSTNLENTKITVSEVVGLDALTVKSSRNHKTLIIFSSDNLASLRNDIPVERLKLLEDNILVTEKLNEVEKKLLETKKLNYVAVHDYDLSHVFVLIKAVITESYAAEDRFVAHIMSVLTLVSRTGGSKGVLSELSRFVDGWAVLVDRQGHVLESVGAGRLHIDDAIAVVLNRPVRIRYPDLQVHVVGGLATRGARLVVASRSESAYRVRSIASHAAALLALIIQTSSPSAVERHGRKLMFDTLIKGGADAVEILESLHLNENLLGAFVLSSKTKNINVAQLVHLWLVQGGGAPLYVSEAREVYGFTTKDNLKRFRQLAEEFKSGLGETVTLGLGDLAPVDNLGLSFKQAQEAHEVALKGKQTVVRFKDIPSIKLGIIKLDQDQRNSLRSVLDPLLLSTSGSAELLLTLRVFLINHGSPTPTAKALGIHRQTLSSRIEKIEQALGLSLDIVDNRALLWFALRTTDKGIPTAV